MFAPVKIEKIAVWRETEASPSPDVSFVPPLARRRLTDLEKAALAVANEVYPHGEEIPVVFASRWGEIGTTVKLIKQFHSEKEMSPAAFSTSVHNAAPGMMSLKESNHATYTAIAASEDSLKNGFVEALAMRKRLLFVYAEERTPEFYRQEFGEPQKWCSLAVLMDTSESENVSFGAIPSGFDRFLEWLGRGNEA
jgi:hypothetical protein